MISNYEYHKRKQLIKNANGYGCAVELDNDGQIVIYTGLQEVKTRDGIQWEAIGGLESAPDSDEAVRAEYRALTKLSKAQRTLAKIDALLNPEGWLTEGQIDAAVEAGTLNSERIREWKVDDLEEIALLVRQARMGGVFTREADEVQS
jgi:hypothetical protein